jgi:hypothetical protein
VIDPHVVSLHYKLVTGEGVIFKDPQSVEQETDEF